MLKKSVVFGQFKKYIYKGNTLDVKSYRFRFLVNTSTLRQSKNCHLSL